MQVSEQWIPKAFSRLNVFGVIFRFFKISTIFRIWYIMLISFFSPIELVEIFLLILSVKTSLPGDFRAINGEFRRSCFCFRRERSFKLGSETWKISFKSGLYGPCVPTGPVLGLVHDSGRSCWVEIPDKALHQPILDRYYTGTKLMKFTEHR